MILNKSVTFLLTCSSHISPKISQITFKPCSLPCLYKIMPSHLVFGVTPVFIYPKLNTICRIPQMKNQYLWKHVFHRHDTDSIFRFLLPDRISTRQLLHYSSIKCYPLPKMSIITQMCIDSKTCISATCSYVTGTAPPVAVTLVNVACLSVIHRNISLSQTEYHGTLLEFCSKELISV